VAAVVVPSVVAPSLTVTVAPASAELAAPLIATEAVLFTIEPLVGALIAGAPGAVVSITMVVPEAVPAEFVAESVEVAVKVCVASPSELVVMIHVPPDVAVAVPIDVPAPGLSEKSSTVVPESAVPVIVGVVALVGVVTAFIVGAVGATVSTVMATAVDAELVLPV